MHELDFEIQPGMPVEGTDGPLGVVRERRTDEGAEHPYLAVETDDGLLFVPERLVREKLGSAVVLSLPVADVKAQATTDLPHTR